MTLHNIVNVLYAISTLKNDYIVNFMSCVCFNNKITKKKTKKNSKKSELGPFCTMSTH